ncbi:TetR/AcrR family transcriptional regulator [Kitasatospora mediocidica]|uniref:TetR/AcrR family transcriptional regulator n=1 Tax=Kitasatospora mediocidica TaxID=58352 RepID=UPI00068E676F|nr:TetR/AcrR family transcriptional regulator [Kitasatospora mediocidica]
MNKNRGRPRGNPATKERIVEVARGLFLEHGYRGTTLRAIAAGADVDSALISYHFGSKRGLFGEATQVGCARTLDIAGALQGDPAQLPDRLLQAVLDLWDQADAGGPGGRDEDALAALRALREYLEIEVLGRLAEYLGGPDATERATAAVTVIGGLIFTRYLNPLPSSAGLSSADVRRILAPALRAALHGRTRRAPSARPRPGTRLVRPLVEAGASG